MKQDRRFPLALAVIFSLAVPAFADGAAKPDFSGNWVFDRAAPEVTVVPVPKNAPPRHRGRLRRDG